MTLLRLTRRAIVVCVSALSLTLPILCYGDDAVVLPKGLTRIFVDTHFYFPFDERYNQNGDPEPYAQPFNTSLNSVLFPSLAPLNPFVPGGIASFGTSQVSFTRHLKEMQIQPAYGLTDRLTVGANIFYYWAENEVTASVNSGPGSGANIGFNPAFPGGIAPLSVPGTTPATTQSIQNLLGSQFGIKPVQTWNSSGIGDLEVGARYQYYRAENFRAAFTGGARFPTGKIDDPDNLVDTAFGKGVYALLFQFQQDYLQQREGLGKRLGFPDPGDFFVNSTFRYDWNLPSTQTLRVCPGGTPFCNTKDNVNTKVGDAIQAEVSGRVGLFFSGLNFSPLYQYAFKFKDHYSGDKGLDYGSLNQQLDNTRDQTQSHIYILQLTYTTIPLYIQNRFPYPLVLQVAYRDRFAGSGGVAKSQYVGFTFQAFF